MLFEEIKTSMRSSRMRAGRPLTIVSRMCASAVADLRGGA